MAKLIYGAKVIALIAVLGAVGYEVQHYWLNQFLIGTGVKRHWELDMYDVWPLGAMLGVLTGGAIFLSRMQDFKAAKRICLTGGALATTCLVLGAVLLCWQSPVDRWTGAKWTPSENILGLLPVVAFGMAWAIGLLLRGLTWPNRRPT